MTRAPLVRGIWRGLLAVTVFYALAAGITAAVVFGIGDGTVR